MRFLLYVLLVAVLGFILAQFLPWWSVAIAGFAAPWIIKRGYWGSFAGGFLGIFLLWAGMSFWIATSTDSLLPTRVAQLISPAMGPEALMVMSGLVGGLVSGVASISARILRG